MTKAEKKYVVAWTHAQARHFAQSMEWSRSEWVYIDIRSPEKLLGLYNVVLYDVRAPRYHPTRLEADNMERFWEAIYPMISSTRIAKLNVVNLP